MCLSVQTLTPALANKMIKQLKDRADALIEQERATKFITYSDASNRFPTDYSFDKTQKALIKINGDIIKIRHCVNVLNATSTLPNLGITVDAALIEMAMLTEMKDRLSLMRTGQIKESRPAPTGVVITEKMYNPAEAASEYEAVMNRLNQIQLDLDKFNLTQTFEIDI